MVGYLGDDPVRRDPLEAPPDRYLGGGRGAGAERFALEQPVR
jgi:hypothetical protein